MLISFNNVMHTNDTLGDFYIWSWNLFFHVFCNCSPIKNWAAQNLVEFGQLLVKRWIRTGDRQSVRCCESCYCIHCRKDQPLHPLGALVIPGSPQIPQCTKCFVNSLKGRDHNLGSSCLRQNISLWWHYCDIKDKYWLQIMMTNNGVHNQLFTPEYFSLWWHSNFKGENCQWLNLTARVARLGWNSS